MGYRDDTLKSFDPGHCFTFSHVMPFQYTDFIDDMAWVGAMGAGALLSKDSQLAEMVRWNLTHLMEVGPDARNYAPKQVSSKWIASASMPGYWYIQKPQSFAGPIMYYMCRDLGMRLPEGPGDVLGLAKIYCVLAPLFGWLIRPISVLRQHINSVMFAHLRLGRRPPSSLRFLARDNKIYAYLYGEKCSTPYRNTGIWPAKDWPDPPPPEKETRYTPICNLTGDMLQSLLEK